MSSSDKIFLKPTNKNKNIIKQMEVFHMATGQKPVSPVNIPIPTKIGSKIGGEFTYQPKWDPIGFDPQPYFLANQPTTLATYFQ